MSNDSQARQFRTIRLPGIGVAVGVWLALILIGVALMARYAGKPGTQGLTIPALPVMDGVVSPPGLATLVMAVHPACPCTRASINELEILMNQEHGKLTATVLFVELPGMNLDVTTTDLWKSASRIPGVICERDLNGIATAKLGAKTSGHVFLYDASHRLIFNGGITESRGNSGDNDGLISIENLLDNKATPRSQTPVYGCSIW